MKTTRLCRRSAGMVVAAFLLPPLPIVVGGPLNPPVDLQRAFPFPTPDEVLGPAVVGCSGADGCLSYPDVLESADETGARIRLDQLAISSPGDYLAGTASEIGLRDTPEL